jgi:hypothetical protein
MLLACAVTTARALETPADLSTFLQNHWQHTLGNDARIYADDFASAAEYCFSKGQTDDMRVFIAQDRQKLLDRWPDRDYSDAAMQLRMVSPEEAKYTFEFDCKYRNGQQSTSGHCLQVADVQKVEGRWKIMQFDEGIEKPLPQGSKFTATNADAATVISDLGLIGTWVATSNWKIRFNIEAGRATVTLIRPSYVTKIDTVRNARVAGNRIVVEEIDADSGAVFDVSYIMVGHSIRIWDSRTKDTVYVKDGISQTKNVSSEWYTKVETAPSSGSSRSPTNGTSSRRP